ncbi:MAG: M48 family metallopeptidase [Pseudomonadota bacterium]|nr:M48 family metallopeptidase [Pseudomonadota bacterium]
MEYRSVLPKKNHNVSHANPIKEFLTLFSALVLLILLAYWSLGFFIDFAIENISTETELEIIEISGVSRELINQNPGFNDLAKRLNDLLSDLNQCAGINYSTELFIDSSASINALALPGGKIIVMQGLLNNIQSENGMAFVLAHELAHFKHRDHLRKMGRSAVLLALSIAATGPNSKLSQILTPVNILQSAKFSKDRETAADSAALDFLYCYYSHVGGANELFEFLDKDSKDRNFKMPHYFSSHPEAKKRIEMMQSFRLKRGYPIGLTKKLILD